ncbi:MAG: hypothetical protein PUP93_10445 [Rhizonema sp. NSF051]|nr:hypothetical protein [Rhizonema sp. NSF051]
MKRTFQTAIISVTGTAAAIAIGIFSAQYFGPKPGTIIGGGLFGTGAAMGIRQVLTHKAQSKEQAE